MRLGSYDTQISPLASWGDFRGQRRLSDSPYLESVWEGIAHRDGIHQTAADGTIDLTFRKRRGACRLLLSGPTSKMCLTHFEAGDEVLTIRLRTGVHTPAFASSKLIDIATFLPNAGKNRFWLQSNVLAFPTFENVETFANHLAARGLLQRDIVVEDMLAKRSRNLSLRSIQRHFLAATGLRMNHIRQIRRAEQARSLLASGHTLATIAYEVGYSNPAHMTTAFTFFFGQTPSAMRALVMQT